MTGKLPLHILTGFLGSGKTALLNRMLRSPGLTDSAILINEIGAVAIDHHLVQQVDRGNALDIMVLKGGCTCCTVRGDLVEALRVLHARRAEGQVPPFRRVILETTGLADPAPVLFTLVGDPVLRPRFEAGIVIATVDAVHGAGQLDRHPECRKQVAVADRLIVTKSDMTGAETVARLAAVLARLNPAAGVVDVRALDSLESLLAKSPLAQRLGSNRRHDGHAEHTPGVMAAAFTLDEPIEWAPFSVWLSLLSHAHGDKLLRFKALLDVTGWNGPVALDGVHHLIHPPTHLPAWPDGERASRIVLIAQGLSTHGIERSLRTFLATHRANREPPVVAAASR